MVTLQFSASTQLPLAMFSSRRARERQRRRSISLRERLVFTRLIFAFLLINLIKQCETQSIFQRYFISLSTHNNNTFCRRVYIMGKSKYALFSLTSKEDQQTQQDNCILFILQQLTYQTSPGKAKSMQQAQFVLNNLFIIHPNPQSDYKLRIIINHDSTQEKLKKNQQKYQFKFSINQNRAFQKPYGSIVLLERVYSQLQGERFLEIGKGDVDFNEIIMQSKGENGSMNGVIYGTRASNYDKVIAKYSYLVIKRKIQAKQVPNQSARKARRIKFKDHIHKQKLPNLRLKQSILDRSSNINAKIRQLSENIYQNNESMHKLDNILKKDTIKLPMDSRQSYQLKANRRYNETIQFGTQYNQNRSKYYYRINQKVEKMIAEQGYHQLKWITIKNIKIFSHKSTIQTNQHTGKDLQQMMLLKIYEHSYYKLIELIIQFQRNANHNFIDVSFPLPYATSSLAFQATFYQQKWQTLKGLARIISSTIKTVELYNDQDEEKGFISIDIIKNADYQFDLEDYTAQKTTFANFQKQLSQVSNKSINISRLDNNYKSPLPNVANPFQKRSQLPQVYESLDKKKNHNYDTLSRNKRSITQFKYAQRERSAKQSTKYRKIIRRPKYSLEIYDHPKISNKSLQKVSYFNPIPLPATRSLSLKIKNIYINLYENEAQGPLQLTFSTNQQTSIEVHNGYNGLEDTGPIILDDLNPNKHIKGCLYQANSHSLIGSCLIDMQSLIRTSSANSLKIFVAKHDFLVGYINLQVSLYRIKNNQVKAVKKHSLQRHQIPQYYFRNEQYELPLSPQRINNAKLITKSAKKQNQNQFDESFLLQQSNFY